MKYEILKIGGLMFAKLRNFILLVYNSNSKALQSRSRPEPEMSREQVDKLLSVIQKAIYF